MTAAMIVQLVTSIVDAVGPEIARAILDHGAGAPGIPETARAQVRAILYPDGGSLLASEVEHKADVEAAAAAAKAVP